MITEKMMLQYNDYIKTHLEAVSDAFGWLYDYIPDVVSPFGYDYAYQLIRCHDESKWSDEEYLAYCEYFYGDRTPEVCEEFDAAWLHHQHNNPHHWQHWVLREDSGAIKPIPMPTEYIVEMFCDHWAFSWVKGNLREIFTWYENNKDKMVLHEETRAMYESLLSIVKSRLDEVGYIGE